MTAQEKIALKKAIAHLDHYGNDTPLADFTIHLNKALGILETLIDLNEDDENGATAEE